MGGGDRFPHRPPVSQPLLLPDSCLIQPSANRRHLHAVVELGSNGIRCSVSDLSHPTARILPTVYKRRVDISLYDAQFDHDTGCQIPIPHHVIKSVVGAIVRFQITCAQIGVPPENIRIVATEATRTALNAEEFVDAIRQATNVSVETLPKEYEGTIGAWGIASSFSDIEGLAMDLGGGSMQMTWIVSHAGNVRISPKGSFSFPYGAAALTQKLNQLRKGKTPDEACQAEEALRREMESNFRIAFEQLEIPDTLVKKARKEGGFPVYLSGGGFRGWGYLLLYLHQVRRHYYPISIINGFSAPKEDFEDTEVLKKVARTARDIFRVSDRRREQVPSVAFLINVLAEAVPYGIKEAHFCQGGVREGILFRDIPPFVRQQDPLEVATTVFARPSAQMIAYLMFGAIPRPTEERTFPASMRGTMIQAFANALFVHAAMAKETSSTAALYSTSAGLLASTHGIPHADRARLALMLQERYGGELPPREKEFKHRLRDLLTREEVWWIRYLGKLGLVIARLYPVGVIDPARPRVATEARWASNLGKRGDKKGIELKFFIQKVAFDPTQLKSELEQDVRKIHKGNVNVLLTLFQLYGACLPARRISFMCCGQIRQEIRKPLIVLFSKSSLRHPLARSALESFVGERQFQPLFDDPEHGRATTNPPGEINRVIFCSGQVFELRQSRVTHRIKATAVTGVKNCIPFPGSKPETFGSVCFTQQTPSCVKENRSMDTHGVTCPRFDTIFGQTVRHSADCQRGSGNQTPACRAGTTGDAR
ncbi:hypothetical protein CNMCM5793_003356 [Aspergillus hiratsukae]|uniref:Ppx/GppA phosphatase domain-containing protein n=1 Tax=Aspergillus hiratsukae TaxID=1194566 RepID=A0A8H6PEF2_9EURO|nr:hypothetical protein CNMCM5793_003356 [Aspergillus hiratsukae]